MLSNLSLRQVQAIDAVITGATGLLMLGGAWILDDLLALPFRLLIVASVLLVAYAAGLLAMTRQTRINESQVKVAITINLGWAIGCVALLAGNWTDANAIGIAFVVMQIVAVLVFSALQVQCLRSRDAGVSNSAFA